MQPDSVKNMSALIKKNITQKSKETYPLRDFKRFSLFLSSLVRGARAKSSSSTSCCLSYCAMNFLCSLLSAPCQSLICLYIIHTHKLKTATHSYQMQSKISFQTHLFRSVLELVQHIFHVCILSGLS